MQDYMKIQNRLMEEQIQLWSDCELGKSILKDRRPSGIDEFRRLVPLTTYEDYADMLHNYEDPTFTPPTYLMDEVVPGEKYELVITVLKGGAFARYRVGDMYRCVGLTNQEDRTQIPRFEYIDRVPWIIDIAGFTRISENGIKSVIQLSGQPVTDWIAVKEYNEKKRPYLHLYIEVKKEAQKKR